MPILRTEAVRGERVNAELSRANLVPWDTRFSVVLLAHTLTHSGCNRVRCHTPHQFPMRS